MGKLKIVIGAFLSTISLFFVIAALNDVIEGEKVGIAVPLGVMFLLVFLFGMSLIRSAILQKTAEKEREALTFCESQRGKVTIVEVTTHCNMSLKQSEYFLENCCRQGLAERQVTTEGGILYVVHGFLSQNKDHAYRLP